MQCDMCGNEKNLVVAEIEGTQLNVCESCARFGKVIRRIIPPRKEKIKQDIYTMPELKRELIQVIMPNYGQKIKNARERMNLKQEDFAKQINEKTSLIQHIESGKHEPSMSLARKLERFLKIRLIEQHEESHEKGKKAESGALTIGDLIKNK